MTIPVHPWIRRRLESFRNRFPNAYCRGRNVVALGEWWWARGREDAYDDAFWDFHGSGDWNGLAALVLRYCPAHSIVDIGCGQGMLLDAFRQTDPALVLQGYDGSATARVRAQSRGLSVEPLDVVALSDTEAEALSHHLALFDLALCLEVAEHIPAWHSGKLLTILSGARRLVFSAARPNQGGRFHVNEQPAAYWIDRLATCGFMVSPSSDELRSDLQAMALPPWYKENIRVFEKTPG